MVGMLDHYFYADGDENQPPGDLRRFFIFGAEFDPHQHTQCGQDSGRDGNHKA